jgi:hypothetical protein
MLLCLGAKIRDRPQGRYYKEFERLLYHGTDPSAVGIEVDKSNYALLRLNARYLN